MRDATDGTRRCHVHAWHCIGHAGSLFMETVMEQNERDQAIRQAIHERLLGRAVTDLEFRRLLIDNPKSALARELGIDIPDDVHVTVLPESENHLFIIIPPLSSEATVTGVERMASVSPAYHGGNTRMTMTGIDRLAGPGKGVAY